MISEQLRGELDHIKGAKATLKPLDMITWAKRNPKSALCGHLVWDDETAGHEYRLNQCRRLMSLYVVVIENISQPVRAYVSLARDRVKGGGGYRRIEVVMKNPDMRAELLEQALYDLDHVKLKYTTLTELAEVWDAKDRVAKRIRKRKKKRKKK